MASYQLCLSILFVSFFIVSEGKEMTTVLDNSLAKKRNISLPKQLRTDDECIKYELEKFRSLTGNCTNIDHPTWGEIGRLQFTLKDDLNAEVFFENSQMPSPREVSNRISNQGPADFPNARGLTSFLVFFGQFVDHCIATTPEDPNNRKDILISNDPFRQNKESIHFARTIKAKVPGTSFFRPTHGFSSAVELTGVYGVNPARLNILRESTGGRLKTHLGQGYFPPLNEQGLKNFPDESEADEGNPSKTQFVTGDSRINENSLLTLFHILFLREHNRLADKFLSEVGCASLSSSQCNDKIFNLARRMNGLQFQKIVFEEFFPMLTNMNLRYRGYQPDVNPSLSIVFTSAAFRFGHTMISENIERRDSRMQLTDATPLRNEFNVPSSLFYNFRSNFESLFRGLLLSNAQEVDPMAVDSLRNFLFLNLGSNTTVDMDLIAINIHRSRDNNVPLYNELRSLYGLPSISRTDFNRITSNTTLASTLRSLYGVVDNIDAWIGLMAEDKSRGSSFGETMLKIMENEFTRLSHGDYFHYRNSASISSEISSFSEYRSFSRDRYLMRTILLRNSDLTSGQVPSVVWQIRSSDFLTSSGSCFEPSRFSQYDNGYNWKNQHMLVAYSRADTGNLTYVFTKCNSCTSRGQAGLLLNRAGITLEKVKRMCADAGIRDNDRTRPIYDCSDTSLSNIISPILQSCTPPTTATPTPTPTRSPSTGRTDFLSSTGSCFEPLRYSAYRIGYTWKSRYVIVAYSRVDTGKLTYVFFTCNSCTSSQRIGNVLNSAGVTLSLVKSRCRYAGYRAGSSSRPVYDCASSSLDSYITPVLATCTPSPSTDFLSSSIGSCFEPLRYSAYRIGYTWKSRYVIVAYSRVDTGKLTYVFFTCNSCTSSQRIGNVLNSAGVTLSLVKSRCRYAGYRSGSSSRPVYDCASSSLDSYITPLLSTCP